MAKLDWNRARHSWAYTRAKPAKPIGRKPPKYAAAARYYSEISSLSRRIERGKAIMAKLPRDHPRYQECRDLLTNLINQRRKLQNPADHDVLLTEKHLSFLSRVLAPKR